MHPAAFEETLPLLHAENVAVSTGESDSASERQTSEECDQLSQRKAVEVVSEEVKEEEPKEEEEEDYDYGEDFDSDCNEDQSWQPLDDGEKENKRSEFLLPSNLNLTAGENFLFHFLQP